VGTDRRDVTEELTRCLDRFPEFATVWNEADEDVRERYLTWMSMPRWRGDRRWRVRSAVKTALDTGQLR